MRRKLAIAAVSVATVGVAAGIASAGAPTIDADGNFLALDAALHPPVAGKSVAVEYRGFFGNNRTGERPPYNGDIALRVPAGMKSNLKLLKARCPLPTTEAQAGDETRCPAGSQIGKGDAVVDARPALAAPIPATLKAYNGGLKNGQPTVVLIGKVGGSVSAEIDLVYRKLSGGKFAFEFAQIPTPGDPTTPAPYSFVTFNITTQKRTVKAGSKRVPLLQAPAKCSGTWAFQQENKTSDGTRSIVANDTAPCAPR